MTFRRRRRQVPDLNAKPFTDSRADSVRGQLLTPSAPQFFGATERAPASLVHRSTVGRLLELDDSSSNPYFPRRVWGAQPHVSPSRGSPIVRVGTVSGSTQVTRRSTLYKPAVSFSWRAFNVIRFRNPREAICVRRAVRRSVLFAHNRAGRGGSYRSPRHRNEFSHISCR